jgi:uncharacterized protein
LQQRNKLKKYGFGMVTAIFAFLNIVANFHSYKFTHFADNELEKTKEPENLSTGEKISTLIFGVNNPRPENAKNPTRDYETIKLRSNKEIECWRMQAERSKGTVILLHGYGSNKASMLDKSDILLELGYSTFLVDFMGSGGSEGKQTTIGFFEAEQVKTCYDYLTEKGEQNIFILGTSMGAVATMKAIKDDNLQPKGIVIECPFGSMYQTVCARFKMLNAPTFPMAGLLVFWGGVQNGFWAFGHNPVDYAKSITCPTLLLYGAKDIKVSQEETDQIFKNLSGQKRLSIYPEAGHENYLITYENEWTQDIQHFLSSALKDPTESTLP